MHDTNRVRTLRLVHAMPAPIAGVLGGLIAGAAYLAAQMSFHVLIAGRSAWEPLQRIAATTQRLDMALAEIDRQRAERQRFEDAVTGRMERQQAQIAEIRERLTRLEASREADRSQMAAELARFMTELERAELRLTRLMGGQSEPPALPGS